MNRFARASLGLLVSLAATSAFAADSATGAVNLEGIKFNVVDGLAYPSRGGLAIALTNTAFDKQKMREDGKVDIFDRMGHGGQSVSINLDGGKPTMCVDYSFHEGDTSSSGSQCASGIDEAIRISQLDDQRVAGSMDWSNDDGESIKVKFDLAIEPGGN